MNIAKISVNNPVTANILMVAVILLGLTALVRLPREFLPNISFNMAIILTSYPGVSPEEIEKLITIKIEDEIEDVDKIDFISSKSTEGLSTILIRFEDMSDTDFKFIIQDLRSEVDSINDLPDDAEDPIVLELATGEMIPVVFVTLSGDLPERELKNIADDMKDRFLEIHNIAKVEYHIVDGQQRRLLIHRKGATRAFGPNHPNLPERYKSIGQPVIIPGDMGRASYLLVGTDQAMRDSFGSTCHGAGRNMSRRKAVRRTKGRNIDEELAQNGGGYGLFAGCAAGDTAAALVVKVTC